MDTLILFKGAHDTFGDVLRGVRTDQLDEPANCEGWVVRDLPAHVTSVTQHFGGVRVASGRDDLTRMKAAVAAARDVDELVALHAEAAQGAYEAFAAPDGLTRSYELTWWSMSFPGEQIAPILAMDCFAHAWDLARSTNQPTDFDRSFAQEALGIARQTIPGGDRSDAGGQFDAEQPCDPLRPAADQLAAYLGRVVD